MGEERWNDRLIRLRAWAREKMRPHPIKVEPRHRISGPTQIPSDWYDPDKQRFMGEQCHGCHENQPYGVKLHGGKWCGACWVFRLERKQRIAGGGGDLPPAA